MSGFRLVSNFRREAIGSMKLLRFCVSVLNLFSNLCKICFLKGGENNASASINKGVPHCINRINFFCSSGSYISDAEDKQNGNGVRYSTCRHFSYYVYYLNGCSIYVCVLIGKADSGIVMIDQVIED